MPPTCFRLTRKPLYIEEICLAPGGRYNRGDGLSGGNGVESDSEMSFKSGETIMSIFSSNILLLVRTSADSISFVQNFISVQELKKAVRDDIISGNVLPDSRGGHLAIKNDHAAEIRNVHVASEQQLGAGCLFRVRYDLCHVDDGSDPRMAGPATHGVSQQNSLDDDKALREGKFDVIQKIPAFRPITRKGLSADTAETALPRRGGNGRINSINSEVKCLATDS